MLRCASFYDSFCGSFYFQQVCILPLKGRRVYLRTFKAVWVRHKNIAKVLSTLKITPQESTPWHV